MPTGLEGRSNRLRIRQVSGASDGPRQVAGRAANHAPADSPLGRSALSVVDRLTIHGLLASSGRIRQTAYRSQARMVGDFRKRSPGVPARNQYHKLSSRRCTHRRIVDGSGDREGSLQCGAACSTGSPAIIRSQASCRQRKLKCPAGASQSGKSVNVFLHGRHNPRRTHICSCWSS
jgi:hypothetical protein